MKALPRRAAEHKRRYIQHRDTQETLRGDFDSRYQWELERRALTGQ